MENITSTLGIEQENTETNLTTLISVISAVGGVLSIICGYLLKAHIQKSSCMSGRCFECVCVDSEEKEEVEKTLKRVRTEKKRRKSEYSLSPPPTPELKEHSEISIV